MRARSLVITFILVVAAAGCSSSKKSTDTTIAAANSTLALDATTVAPETTVAADTTAASAATTVASETTAAADTTVASQGTVASDTTVAAGVPVTSVAAPSADVLITGFLQSMNGGKVPSAKDIKCVTSKVDPAALAALGASASGAPDPKVLLPVVKSIFSCKPDGLVDSLSTSLGNLPAGVTAEQTKCIASGLVDVMGSDDKLLELTMTTGSLKELPKADRDAVVAKLTPTVNKCVDGDLRAKVLAELQK